MIINTKDDLVALRGTEVYAEALRSILGATTMWVNDAAVGEQPLWRQASVGDTLARLDLTVDELLVECAAAGIVPQTPEAPVNIPPAPAPPVFLARDLIALLTPDDYAAIQAVIAGSAPLGLLWAGLLGQGDAPISTANERFQQGWAGLSAALGSARANAIAAVLGIPTG